MRKLFLYFFFLAFIAMLNTGCSPTYDIYRFKKGEAVSAYVFAGEPIAHLFTPSTGITESGLQEVINQGSPECNKFLIFSGDQSSDLVRIYLYQENENEREYKLKATDSQASIIITDTELKNVKEVDLGCIKELEYFTEGTFENGVIKFNDFGIALKYDPSNGTLSLQQ